MRNIYCQNCGVCFTTRETKAKFCSRSCAGTYNNSYRPQRTEESKRKTSTTILNAIASGKLIPRKGNCKEIIYFGPYTKVKMRECTHCKKNFWAARDRVTCSDECRRERSTYNNVKKQHIAYFNIFDNEHIHLHSNWEVIIADWLTENNIPWSRPYQILYWTDENNKQRRYTPDFVIKSIGLYVDVKNPLKMKQDKQKLDILTKNYNLLVGDIEQCKEGIMAALLRFERRIRVSKTPVISLSL